MSSALWKIALNGITPGIGLTSPCEAANCSSGPPERRLMSAEEERLRRKERRNRPHMMARARQLGLVDGDNYDIDPYGDAAKPTPTAAGLTEQASGVGGGKALTIRGGGSSSDDDGHKGPPRFSGDKDAFIAWFMAFSGYVAYKLVAAAPILDGTRARPPAPPPALMARASTRPPDPPAPVANADGTVANQADIDAATTAIAAWDALPMNVVSNQAAIDAAEQLRNDWDERNMRLYGLLVQALPQWLITSIYNTCRNDGVAAIEHLRLAFDANANDGGDHAAHLAKLQSKTIDARADVSEVDLRKYFDMLVSEKAAIERTGNAPPAEKTMIAFYDNGLPISYSTMRQHARRANHGTLLAHHMDIMSQVRAEVNARAAPPNAFAATGVGNGGGRGNGGGGGIGGGSGSANADKTCLRCGKVGHTRRDCPRRPTCPAASRSCGGRCSCRRR